MTTIETQKLNVLILEPTSKELKAFEGNVSLSDLKLTNVPDDIILIKAIGEDIEIKIDRSHEESSESTLVYTGFLKMYRSDVKLIIRI